jgi:glycosyltransferase involved in cell wall biosynthesis
MVDVSPVEHDETHGREARQDILGPVPEAVSVIVPTRNSAGTLADCLRSIRAQTHEDVEVVVVDNRSTDGTPEIARELADVVLDAGPERSAQRNAGARAARGDFLAFVDSDMTLEPGVVADCLAEVERGAIAVVIPEQSFGDGYWTQAKILERSCYYGDETMEAARFFPREVFDRVGGFDEDIVAGPEDWDLHARVRALGGPIGHSRALIWHDEGRLRLRETMATKYYYGKSTAAYLRKHPELARQQLTIVRPAFLRHWRRLAARPHLAAGMIVMKALELASGAAGLLVSRAASRRAAAAG